MVAVKVVHGAIDDIQLNIVQLCLTIQIVIIRSPHLDIIRATRINNLRRSPRLLDASSVHNALFEEFGIRRKCAWNFCFVRGGRSTSWRQHRWFRTRNLIILSFGAIIASFVHNFGAVLIMRTLLALNISLDRILRACSTSTANRSSRVSLTHGILSTLLKFIALIKSVSHGVLLLQFQRL